MTSRRRWNEFKAWLRDFFFSEDENGIQDGPQRRAGPEGFFNNAQHSTLHNPTMTAVHGNNNQFNTVTYAEGNCNIVTQIMGLLSRHTIPGAEHDSSARDPPPRCHPDTRVKMIARITAWFEGQTSLELLLWITGPAGVGKSAVIQTFAEYLVESHLLGASVFISRHNERDKPHGVFVTIAYQLATRIEAYRDYIIERLSRDPELTGRGMQAQFVAFIIDPFVKRKIGAGGKRWGILLDGLDELQGEDAQCEIILLISSFAHDHPDAPLVWIIASRPESRISQAFEDEEMRHNCLVEKIPIDSTEACKDVERFLRSSFETARKNFRHCVSSDWPSNANFLKLTAAASGLFIYAQVVVQFIGDSHHAHPVARLEVLLSVIDRSNAVPSQENPFVHLDALYREILSSISSTAWPTTRKLLGVAIHGTNTSLGSPENSLQHIFLTLRGMSIIFGVTRITVYASLDKSRSTLKTPDWKDAHKKPLTFLHKSFADYLMNSKRSRDFYVGSRQDISRAVIFRLIEIWYRCSGDGIAISSIEAMWQQYCSKLDDKSPSSGVKEFYNNLFHDTMRHIALLLCSFSRSPKEFDVFKSLRRVHMRKLCHFFTAVDMENYVRRLLEISPEPRHIGLIREVQLKDLEFGHLDWKEMSPTYTRYAKESRFFTEKPLMIHRPRSSAELTIFVSELVLIWQRLPEFKVLIIGGVPKERVAIFRVPLVEKSTDAYGYKSYIVPYPE